ncbi:hypothetical protein [Micromonospora sp. NBS 11-29]|uniref:hypothetical protein n=1 Tax=Micromonospora sp. NBS 11-29 TaxID=1960879 RepID=UPI001123EE30|nr:hypothetical protein [Micromonospora sp. NBS 11-29]
MSGQPTQGDVPGETLRGLRRQREATIVTWGRRTGAEHRVVVWWAGGDHGLIYVMAGYGPRTDWARNSLTERGALVRIANHRFQARARVVEPGPEHTDAAKALADKYAPYPGDWENGHIIALALTAA